MCDAAAPRSPAHVKFRLDVRAKRLDLFRVITARHARAGSAVVRAALDQAWAVDCHHVLMQSSRADARVHRFYEHLGFLPGRRTAYVAPKPE